MFGPVDICNRALSRLGHNRIAALTDKSVAAEECNSAFAMIRDEVYQSHPWQSVTHREEWTKSVTAPAWGFANAYDFGDADKHVLRVLRIKGIAPDAWTVEGRSLLLDSAGPIKVQYIYREEQTELLDPLLASAIASRLAMELCEKLTQSTRKWEKANTEYQGILQMAKRTNAMQGSPTKVLDTDWLTARNT